MRRRGGTAREPTVETDPAIPRIAVVDTALADAARRDRFSTDQALDLLRDVEAGVSEPALRSQIAEIVGSTTAATVDRPTVDREELVNALLDIRLVVCH